MDIEQIKLALEQSRPDTDVERDEKRLPAEVLNFFGIEEGHKVCLLYTSPSPRDGLLSRMPSSA